MANPWKYNGDMNLECGGFYWQESGVNDHVYCVDVIPLSDLGGPDNAWLIESGTIYIGNDETRIKSALDCIGETVETASRADIVYAIKAYCGQDVATQSVIMIGKPSIYDSPLPDWCKDDCAMYRGNWKLKNLIRREYIA